MRDKDWLVSDEAWPTSVVGLLVAQGTFAAIPLTYNTSAAFTASRPENVGAFQPNDNWTLEAIRGGIDLWWDTDEVATSWEGIIDVRLEVMDQGLDGVVAVPSTYKLNDNENANRAFLWSDFRHFWKLTSWVDPEQGSPSHWHIDLHVKSKRRIEANQCVALMISNISGAGTDTPDIGFLPRIRCLGSKGM